MSSGLEVTFCHSSIQDSIHVQIHYYSDIFDQRYSLWAPVYWSSIDYLPQHCYTISLGDIAVITSIVAGFLPVRCQFTCRRPSCRCLWPFAFDLGCLICVGTWCCCWSGCRQWLEVASYDASSSHGFFQFFWDLWLTNCWKSCWCLIAVGYHICWCLRFILVIQEFQSYFQVLSDCHHLGCHRTPRLPICSGQGGCVNSFSKVILQLFIGIDFAFLNSLDICNLLLISDLYFHLWSRMSESLEYAVGFGCAHHHIEITLWY